MRLPGATLSEGRTGLQLNFYHTWLAGWFVASSMKHPVDEALINKFSEIAIPSIVISDVQLKCACFWPLPKVLVALTIRTAVTS